MWKNVYVVYQAEWYSAHLNKKKRWRKLWKVRHYHLEYWNRLQLLSEKILQQSIMKVDFHGKHLQNTYNSTHNFLFDIRRMRKKLI